MLTSLCLLLFSCQSADTFSISSFLFQPLLLHLTATRSLPPPWLAIHLHATAARKERQLVGPVHESSLPVTLFAPSCRLLPNNVFYPFGGLQPARLLCSLTMEREEVKLHSAQLIFPNMQLCRRLSFLLLLSSLFSSTSPSLPPFFCSALWVMSSCREVTAFFSPAVPQKKAVI